MFILYIVFVFIGTGSLAAIASSERLYRKDFIDGLPYQGSVFYQPLDQSSSLPINVYGGSDVVSLSENDMDDLLLGGDLAEDEIIRGLIEDKNESALNGGPTEGHEFTYLPFRSPDNSKERFEYLIEDHDASSSTDSVIDSNDDHTLDNSLEGADDHSWESVFMDDIPNDYAVDTLDESEGRRTNENSSILPNTRTSNERTIYDSEEIPDMVYEGI
jgi:hypothetical protein